MWPWAQQLNLWFPEGSGEPVTSAPSPHLGSSSPSLPPHCAPPHTSDLGAPCSGPRAWTLDPGFAKDLLWDPQVSGPGEASSSPVRVAGERALIPSGSRSLPQFMLSPQEATESPYQSGLPAPSCCPAAAAKLKPEYSGEKKNPSLKGVHGEKRL